jgi:4-amino-4-deoxy-L-arabinose transferase-like glycosyltransferase
MIALFGVATVWLIYKVCLDFFDYRVGLIAATFYTFSPIVVSYSRSSWNPNPLPFFALLTLYLLYKAIKKKKVLLFVLVGFLLGIDIQLHYLTLFLIMVVFAYQIFSQFYVLRKSFFTNLKEVIKNYFMIFVGFLVGVSPFLAFEVRHGFPNTQSIFNFIFHSKDTGAGNNFFTTVYDVFFRLFARLVFNFPSSAQYYQFGKGIVFAWQYLALVFALLSFVFLIVDLIKNRKDKDSLLKYGLLLVWFVVGVLLFGLYKKEIYEYYFGFMFPLPFILFSLFLVRFLKNRIGQILIIIIFGVVLLVNIMGMPFRYAPNRQLAQMETISSFVMTKTDSKPFNFALITGGNSDYAYRYFFTVWNHPPITIENKQIDPQRKTVTGQLFVVCESLPCEPRGNSLWEIAGFGQADIAGEWDVSVVKVYKLVHYKGK